MKRTFTGMEDKLFHQLDEPFRSRALQAAYRVNDRLALDPTCYLGIRDAWRSAEDQLANWKKGRIYINGKWENKHDPLEPTVTNAVPGRSPHEYRRAIHLVLFDAKTREWLPPNSRIKKYDKRWDIVGEEAEKAGLVWGGHFQDYAHVEAKDWREVAVYFGWSGMTPTDRFDLTQGGKVKLSVPDLG